MAHKIQSSDFLLKNVSFLLLFADCCEKRYILEGVSFEKHQEFQITLSLCVQVYEHVAKTYFLPWTFLNCST